MTKKKRIQLFFLQRLLLLVRLQSDDCSALCAPPSRRLPRDKKNITPLRRTLHLEQVRRDGWRSSSGVSLADALRLLLSANDAKERAESASRQPLSRWLIRRPRSKAAPPLAPPRSSFVPPPE